MSDDCKVLRNVESEFSDYLRDESRCVGRADSISFPKREDDVRNCLLMMRESKTPVTVQGARTGITGGAVPDGGHILNLSRMKHVGELREDVARGCAFVKVGPGVLLSELNEVGAGKYFFPPDPTETSASIGGMIACNASGSRSFRYGSTRDYIEGLRVVLADGSILNMRKGYSMVSGRRFSITAENGSVIEGKLPDYSRPNIKNAAGYYVGDDMDLLDLFIGFEGTLGVITEAELRLVPDPAVKWGLMIFFPSEDDAIKFVIHARALSVDKSESGYPAAMEFFGLQSLALLRAQKHGNPAFEEIVEPPDEWESAVYVEYHGADESEFEEAVCRLSDLMAEHGADDSATWLASDEKEMDRLKKFRHAVPEAVNLLIDERRRRHPLLTKLGTDLAVPADKLNEVMKLYHDGLVEADLEHVIFGHIGDNHVHVNILANDMAEYERGGKLYLKWAQAVVAMGGTVSGEHGIGKLKKKFLKVMYGEDGIRQMRELKALFDPENILNRGNLF